MYSTTCRGGRSRSLFSLYGVHFMLGAVIPILKENTLPLTSFTNTFPEEQTKDGFSFRNGRCVLFGGSRIHKHRLGHPIHKDHGTFHASDHFRSSHLVVQVHCPDLGAPSPNSLDQEHHKTQPGIAPGKQVTSWKTFHFLCSLYCSLLWQWVYQ